MTLWSCFRFFVPDYYFLSPLVCILPEGFAAPIFGPFFDPAAPFLGVPLYMAHPDPVPPHQAQPPTAPPPSVHPESSEIC